MASRAASRQTKIEGGEGDLSKLGSAEDDEEKKEEGDGAVQDAINAQEEIKDLNNIGSAENLLKP